MSLETRKAMNLLFTGMMAKDIAHRFGVTPQTVRNRRDDFVKRAEEIGLENAAEEIGVKNQVNSLIKLANNIEKNNGTLEKCLTGSEISIVLKTLGIKDKRLKQFLEGLYKYANEHKLSAENLGGLLERYELQCEETGMEYMELVEDYEKKSVMAQDLENRVKEQSNMLFELEKKQEAQLKENKVTALDLKDFVQNRKQLKEMGLDLDEPRRSLKILKEIKAQNHDPKAIIFIIEENGSLEKRNQDLRKLNQKHEKENLELESELSEKRSEMEELETKYQVYEEKCKQLEAPLKALGELNNMSLGNPELLDLRKLVIESKLTIPGLRKTLEEYGGFDELLETRRDEKRSLENQIENLEDIKTKLEPDIAFMEDRKMNLIEESQDVLRKIIENLQGTREDFKTTVTDPETGLISTVQKEYQKGYDETFNLLRQFQGEYSTRLEKLKVEMDSMYSEVDETKEKIFQLGLTAGQHKSAQYLIKLVLGKEIPSLERRLALASLLDIACSELMKDNRPKESRVIGEIRDKLLLL